MRPSANNNFFKMVKEFPVDLIKIYPKSVCSLNGLTYGLIRTAEGKKLTVTGEKNRVLSDDFQGRYHHQNSSLKLCDLSQIPKFEGLSDQDLPSLLDQEEARQLLHITYGFLLNARTPEGENLFRERLYHLLTNYEEDYWSLLETHFEKLLISLGRKTFTFRQRDHDGFDDLS